MMIFGEDTCTNRRQCISVYVESMNRSMVTENSDTVLDKTPNSRHAVHDRFKTANMSQKRIRSTKSTLTLESHGSYAIFHSLTLRRVAMST